MSVLINSFINKLFIQEVAKLELLRIDLISDSHV